MSKTFDGHFLPGAGMAERPEPRTRLQEMLEGKEIARAVVDQAPGPTGSPVLGLEFTSGERLAIMAKRDANSRYRARLVFRLMPSQKIVTPRTAKLFSQGRVAEPGGAPGDLPGLERRLEGSVIRGVRHIVEPAAWGGESMEMELAGGDVLWLAADQATRDPRYRAELLAQFRRREVTHLWVSGLDARG